MGCPVSKEPPIIPQTSLDRSKIGRCKSSALEKMQISSVNKIGNGQKVHFNDISLLSSSNMKLLEDSFEGDSLIAKRNLYDREDS